MPSKTLSDFRGFSDTEFFFESPQSSNNERILGFKIDKEIFNHYTKKYQFIIKESNKIHTFDIVIDWDSTNRFVSITTLQLFTQTQYSKKIYFRIVKTDAHGNQHVLIVNNAKISMLVSKTFATCRDNECLKRFKEWDNSKSKCLTNDDLFQQLYYTNCQGSCASIL